MSPTPSRKRHFDEKVPFEEDRPAVSRATFMAGEAVSVRMIEVREG